MKRFEYLHTVSFEETNLIGNVYFANYLKWQGICRERFLQEKAPGVLEDIQNGLALVTISCSCNYFGELMAFDKVLVGMYLLGIQQNKVKMRFEYLKMLDGENQLVAEGFHEIGFFMKNEDKLIPIVVPSYIHNELGVYLAS
jgi:enediyne biosynthesis thioesterase